jgi:hypothetical protein
MESRIASRSATSPEGEPGDCSDAIIRRDSLTIDSGWREVADKALDFIKRFVQP